MVLCPKCGCFLASVTSLQFHLKSKHEVHVSHGFNSYSCRDSCYRSFLNWKTYRQHLLNFHNVPVTVTTSNETSSHCENSSQCKRFKSDASSVPSTSTADSIASSESILSSDCDKDSHVDVDPSSSFSVITSNCDNSNLMNSNNSNLSSSNVAAQMQSNAENFLKNLYSSKNVTRKFVQTVVDEVEELVGNNNSFARHAILSKLAQEGVSPETQKLVHDVFNSLQHPFKNLTSDYLRLNCFRRNPLWVEPQQLVIGDAEDLYSARVIPVSVKMSYMPMSDSLKGCLETPGVFHAILEYIGDLKGQNNCISNFIQGPLWKSKISGLTGFHFPLFLFFDDFQVNNSLGPHNDSGKLGGLYASLPILPPHMRSLIDNIFVVLLFRSQDRDTFSNAPVFIKVIEELKELQTKGLNITVNGTSHRVFIHLGLIIGDNLGLTSMLDFVACFTANYCCRFCKIHRDALHFASCEDQTLLRNEDNYSDDVDIDDSSLTGIVADSVWNQLPNFHVCDNLSVDIMHDTLQGTCHYDMAHIVKSLLSQGHFTLAELNFHLGSHDYGSSGGNKPTSIRDENLDSSRFQMSASEMLCFVRNFGIMMGHLVPSDNQVWYFYLVVSKIIDILMCPVVTESLCASLESLVEEHHNLYYVLFRDTLKPKHHNMVHYPRIMCEVGPLIHTWSMRFESKNQAAAVAAHATQSRKNTCKTLALREQITQVSKKSTVFSTITFGKFKHFDSLSDFSDFVACFPFKSNFLLTDSVTYKSVQFKVGSFVHNNLKDEGHLRVFSRIAHVVVQGEADFRFLVCQHDTLCLDEHFNQYVIDTTSCEYKCLQISDLLNINVYPCHNFAGKRNLLLLKYIL